MERAGDQLRTLLDLARQLTARGIRHALIGGIAVGIQSEAPRATDDIDIAVVTTFGREEVVAALEEVGFSVTGRFEHSINLCHESGEPLQVAFVPFFDAMIERAEELEVDDGVVYVLRKDDLIATKERAAADPARRKSKALRDQADIELLRGDVSQCEEGW